ncbi:MAG: hypothetical protein ACREM1_16610 [Longimicrobiales bacterium]
MTSRRGTPTRRTRQNFAAGAVVVATLTGAAAAALGGSGVHVLGAGAYILIVLAALFFPAAIIAPVIAGQLLAANILLRGDGHALVLLPVVAGVIATAELISVVTRLHTTPERDPAPDRRRAGVAVLIGGSIFAVVALAGRLPGPTGIMAIAFAAAACLVLALLLAGDTRASARRAAAPVGGEPRRPDA